MSFLEGYANWRAVEQAIKQAATKAHRDNPARKTQDVIRQAHFDRFLCRIFGGDSERAWVLKGGTGMLARVADGRRTLDVDLYREGYDKDQSLTELIRLAATDLGDHFSFAYRSHSEIAVGDGQPHVDGYHVVFEATLGVKTLQPLQVDLAASLFPAVAVVETEPANRLPLPRLAAFPYRLYPVANQIADKVCATIADYRGKPSSREKDLVDLVVLALTQTVRAAELRDAVAAECGLRGLALPKGFAVPAAWGGAYGKLARAAGPAAAYPEIAAAITLMRRFIDPVLADAAAGVWSPVRLEWGEQ